MPITPTYIYAFTQLSLLISDILINQYVCVVREHDSIIISEATHACKHTNTVYITLSYI